MIQPAGQNRVTNKKRTKGLPHTATWDTACRAEQRDQQEQNRRTSNYSSLVIQTTGAEQRD